MRRQKNLDGWQVVNNWAAPQMICKDLKLAAHIETIQLSKRDVPEMLALVVLAQDNHTAMRLYQN